MIRVGASPHLSPLARFFFNHISSFFTLSFNVPHFSLFQVLYHPFHSLLPFLSSRPSICHSSPCFYHFSTFFPISRPPGSSSFNVPLIPLSFLDVPISSLMVPTPFSSAPTIPISFLLLSWLPHPLQLLSSLFSSVFVYSLVFPHPFSSCYLIPVSPDSQPFSLTPLSFG